MNFLHAAALLSVLTTGLNGVETPNLEVPWEDEARAVGLDEKEISHLTKEKVMMGREELLQCFQAYLPSYRREGGTDKKDTVYFITSDAMLHAYAWCAQKAVLAMEQAHAHQFRQYLESALKGVREAKRTIKGDEAVLNSAMEHALFVMGVAVAMMGVEVAEEPPELKSDIEQEAERVRRATGDQLPDRLGLPAGPFRSLDYTMFKPAGIYAGDADMESYFRAVRWLQVVPFRTESETDMLSAAMLAMAHRANPKAKALGEREKRLAALAGPPSRPGVLRCLDAKPKEDKSAEANALISAVRQHLASQTPAVVSSALDNATPIAVYACVCPASTLADAVFIEKRSRESGPDYFPDPISIAAWMGSDYAAGFDGKAESVYRIRRETAPLLSNAGGDASLHAQMLGLLQKLFKSPAPNAPAFMKSRAWQAKSCQTALAAWTQARHLWTLQAQPHYAVGAAISGWPAFVEPSPWFFVGLADLCKEADRLLANVETTDEISRRIARDLRRQAGVLEAIKHAPNSAGEQRLVITTDSQLSALTLLSDADIEGNLDDPQSLAKGAKLLRESAGLIEKQQADKKHQVAKKLRDICLAQNLVRFQALADVCTKLAALAHKQMQGQGPDAGDGAWLEYFGLTLADFTDCHFTHAVDNVPKAARVFTNLRTQKALTAGIGRPRFLYVLYPWEGHEVLCRGAVLPYLERYDLKTYTDDEWRTSLKDAASPPIQPGWVSPLIAR